MPKLWHYNLWQFWIVLIPNPKIMTLKALFSEFIQQIHVKLVQNNFFCYISKFIRYRYSHKISFYQATEVWPSCKYISSISFLYISCTANRLVLRLGDNSPVATENSLGTIDHFCTVAARLIAILFALLIPSSMALKHNSEEHT